MKFPQLDPKKSIASSEEAILKFWKDNKIFEQTIASRSREHEFRFFDGPPFATGTPHYGHILAGTIKDAIPRYKTMQGYRVERKWGWDCHGVPVEFQVEKENQIGGKPGIEKMGVGKFNELCRSVVMRCADEWEKTVERMGRFVDFKNDYKTMDPEFMESVWWVFGELWKKGLVYEGEKVVAYSPKLGSPLSNFEANLNYRDIDDPAVTVKFELADEPGTYLLAWTTTPWTLPSNLALAVNPDIQYVKVEALEEFVPLKDLKLDSKKSEFVILAKSIFEQKKELWKASGLHDDPEETVSGADLIGKKYKPLFPLWPWVEEERKKGAFRVLGADYVSAEDGTGIVHQAPNFGEDDAQTCFNADPQIKPLEQPIDDSGFFTDRTPELAGLYFRSDDEVEGSKENNANRWVIQFLKNNDLLFGSVEQHHHSYPFCWRTDCALMYRGVRTWFVDVQQVKKLMIEKNQEINWIPDHLRDGRFGKLLESAPDWAISRNRYWGAPIPVWRCEKCGEVHVPTTRAELEKLTGKKVDDLHKHFVDDLHWDCQKCDGKMTRIPEVLDCWFESGAMPYASNKFHGETPDFPSADFIAEGLDQTRGWFYTLHVLGCALFGKNIFKNVVTNGIVLAEDGQKMSKSKKNYPDPNLIFDQYGADAMRYYLLSSPVVRGENFKFMESGVAEVLKSVILPLRSAYQFFSTYANIDGWQPTKFEFVRHGQGDHNVARIYSGNVENQHHLTELGREQVRETGKNIGSPDVIVASPFVRTQETAAIIAKETGYTGEIIPDDRVRELFFGPLEGKNFINRDERMAHPETENNEQVEARVRDFLADWAQRARGKHIVVCSHGGVLASLEGVKKRILTDEERLLVPVPQTGTTTVAFPAPTTTNELDRWILSELQELLQGFGKKFDEYDLEGALRAVPQFVDQLNNWYLRRSRQRFWAAGLDDDKRAGYETLHHVLLMLAKVLAPVCPFFAEELYKNLGGGASVHLELFPNADAARVDDALNAKMAVAREITRLAASIRARAKIKLRQPLERLQVAVPAGVELDLDVIAAEANVKKVEILTDEQLSGVAKKIVKINARLVGKKFGKKVQELIVAGKKGEFLELGDGQIEVAGETIEMNEYEAGFLTAEGVEAEASSDTVALLDTEISSELACEGVARDLIRAVQEARKIAGLKITDRITIRWQSEDAVVEQAFAEWEKTIVDETLANKIETTEVDAEPIKIDDASVRISVTRG